MSLAPRAGGVASTLERRTVLVDGVEWAYREGGPPDAPAVVLVHGLSISSAYMVPTGEGLVGEGFRVLAPDLPGFGRSGAPESALGIAQMAEALSRWMDAVGVPRAHVLANSLGCQVVAALAALEPARVDRMVLVGPSSDPDAGMWEMTKRLAQDAFREKPSLLALHARDDLRAGVRRILATARAALAEPLTTWLPSVGRPTLILRGSKDPLVEASAARTLARRMRRGLVRELAGAPHAANYSAPEAVVAACVPFLRGRDAAFG